MHWPMQQAKARLCELIDRALKEGPQTVTHHGKPVAVVVPAGEYRR
jgi:antitoxin Phd